MADTPDISKVISLIMENPELVAQISSMVRGSSDTEADASDKTVSNEQTLPVSEPITQSASITEELSPRRQNRTRLLYAMKPYLKESRQGAIDTMISIVDILDVMRKR